jgi:hypothetical protein
MDLVTVDDIAALTEPGGSGTQVSMFMPTHRSGTGVETDRLRWKNLVSDVQSLLAQRLRRPEVEALIAPARELYDAALDWQYMSDGLVMYLRDGWHRTFRIPARIPTLATVGDRLVMGPVLRLLSGDGHFLLLALSQRETRLMEGTRNTVEQVELTAVPAGLADVIEPREPRSHTMARPAGAAERGGPAIFFGHGAGDQHVKQEEMMRFLRAVSTGLHEVLNGRNEPLVLVGVERLVAAYREVNTYGHTLRDAVIHSADEISADDLHRMAWPLVEERLRHERTQVIERFHELHGTGLASSDAETVAEAAAEGRVETLFVRADPWCWERSPDSPALVELGADAGSADCERVDTAAVATLKASGRVFATSHQVVPEREMAAILRY